MLIHVWDRWPQFFRRRLRVLYELTGEVRYVMRPPLGWREPGRRAVRLERKERYPQEFAPYPRH
jgi:hypothetical protein